MLVFGGSFDPPHNGHMNLLRNAIAAVGPERVLVVPSGTAPHKAASETPGPIRAAMCACFLPLFPALEVCDIELRRPGKSYTRQTMAQLQAQYPGNAWYLCIGGDMLLGFESWYEWRALLGMVTLVAAAREVRQRPELEQAAQKLQAAGGRVLFAEGPVLPLSSSDIREGMARGRDMLRLVPPPADAIVREQGLYVHILPEDAKRQNS